jgi:pimeloyl-ACP methyl ester carboxylesterase
MKEKRIHRAVSADGTEIAGRVEGQGPALVLIHAPVHDSDMAWEALLPFLADRFTCYLPNLRGRGLSGDHPDPSPSRSQFQEDINAFIDSIGEPVFLMGWSDSCSLAFGAAAHSDAVAAVVAYEPSVWTLMPEDDLARFGTVIEQHREATAEGRLMDATHNFHHFVCTDEELAALDADYLDRQASLFPLLMQELQQEGSYKKTEPTDPEVLAQIDAPVLVLLGQKTRLDTWFTDSAQHVVQHVANAHIRELPDLGHFAPLVAPEPIADELIRFFEIYADRAAQRIEEPLGPAGRIHRAVSPDGAEIAGRLHGQGPSLVLVHGGLGDDTSWFELLPYLTEHFTCYTMNTRGRGLSTAPTDADYSLERLVEDVVAFTASVGEPVGLLGHSLGGALVLGAAAASDSVSAVAVYEPVVFEAPSRGGSKILREKATRTLAAAAEGRLADAARIMIEGTATDDELAALSLGGAFEAWASNVDVAVQEMQQANEDERSSPTQPSVLTRITAPLLYLHGSQTPTTWYTEGARHVADHVTDLRIVEIAGVGHFAPHLAPEAIANELIQFFTSVMPPTEAGGMT